MTDIHDVQPAGWIASGLTGMWGAVMTFIVSRYNRQARLRDEREEERDRLLKSIDRRLSVLEGRFKERDRDSGRRGTWPGDFE